MRAAGNVARAKLAAEGAVALRRLRRRGAVARACRTLPAEAASRGTANCASAASASQSSARLGRHAVEQPLRAVRRGAPPRAAAPARAGRPVGRARRRAPAPPAARSAISSSIWFARSSAREPIAGFAPPRRGSSGSSIFGPQIQLQPAPRAPPSSHRRDGRAQRAPPPPSPARSPRVMQGIFGLAEATAITGTRPRGERSSHARTMRCSRPRSRRSSASAARARRRPPPTRRRRPQAAGPLVRAIEWRRRARARRERTSRSGSSRRRAPGGGSGSTRPPFDEPTLEGDMQRIADTYREYGHYRATRELHAHAGTRRTTRSRSTIDVDEGPASPRELRRSTSRAAGRARALAGRSCSTDAAARSRATCSRVALYGTAKRALSAGAGRSSAFRTRPLTRRRRGRPRHRDRDDRLGRAPRPARAHRRDPRSRAAKTVNANVIQQRAHLQDRRRLLGLGAAAEPAPGLRPRAVPLRADRPVIDPNAPPPEGRAARQGDSPDRGRRRGAAAAQHPPRRWATAPRTSVRAQIGWLHRTSDGPRRHASTCARATRRSPREFQATLKEPHLPDPRTTLWLDSRIRDDTLPAYDDARAPRPRRRRAPAAARLERPDRLRRSSRSDVRKVRRAATARPPDRATTVLGFLELGVRRITTDSLVEPTTRHVARDAASTLASRYLGSQKNYVRWTLDGRGFLPIGPTVRRRPRAARHDLRDRRDHADRAAGHQALLRRRQRNRRAATTSRSSGNDNAPGRPVGGESLLAGSLELRFPIWRELRGATFVDAGQLGTGRLGLAADEAALLRRRRAALLDPARAG